LPPSEREQAQAQRSAVRQDLKTARQNATSAARQAEEQAQRLSQLQQNVTARSRELAEVDQRLEAARQQEAQAREVLAKLTEESAAKTNEVAKAKQQLQQSREAEAAAQTQKTTLTGFPTPAGDHFRDDLNIEDLRRAASPTRRKVDDFAAGPTGSVLRVPSAQPR
jgi:chromosome segregation ATPase